ncbi:HAD family hydrolase [Clostridium peptidivorans]|uniref:HAD family hydrolase n=1 Tax=Clostridium peptidivorans TaxID=100174 RepID=UPI000BE37A8C|nr:HAD family hydrolase [Clostridium peptidivorans]
MNTILFDLDGTLLSMDAEEFEKSYFNEIGKSFSDLMEPMELGKHIWGATKAMVSSLDERTNEEVFMEDFNIRVNNRLHEFMYRFDDFYDNEFLRVQNSVNPEEHMIKSVKMLKEKGYNVVVVTNPLFPIKAIHHRIRWAGFEPEDFTYITSFEKNHYCKPQIKFYEEVLKDINKTSEECLMVGNDTVEDLVAKNIGIKTYLINNNILNKSQKSYITDYEGNYEEFYKFIESLPCI